MTLVPMTLMERHTQATLLIAQGVDIKTIQGRLGHEKASTTLDTYAGILPENDREAANVFGAILEKPRNIIPILYPFASNQHSEKKAVTV